MLVTDGERVVVGYVCAFLQTSNFKKKWYSSWENWSRVVITRKKECELRKEVAHIYRSTRRSQRRASCSRFCGQSFIQWPGTLQILHTYDGPGGAPWPGPPMGQSCFQWPV